MAVASFDLWRGWRSRGRAFLAGVPARAEAALVAAGVAGLAWFVVIAVLTQAGFSGNNRYLVLGSALIEIAGAVGWGWAAQEGGNLLRRGAGGETAGGAQACADS